jgi:adenosine deaminase
MARPGDDRTSGLLSRADLIALPKAHLHLHLEGSARPETIRELAERAGITLPALDECTSFSDLDRLYLAMLEVIQAPEDLARICRELVEDEAAVGVPYLEPAINPMYWAERFRITPEEALAVMRVAFADAGREHGVEVGLLITCVRVAGAEVAETLATFAADHADSGVVAFGICGHEPSDAHRPYKRACEIAHAAGLLVVPHAGEQQGAASVRDALEHLAPDRIAHGIGAVEDPAVLADLSRRGIPCDVCVSSNVALGLVPSLTAHPVSRMRAADVRVTLGADDALFFGADLADEYDNAQRHCRVQPSDLAQIARDAAGASGATAATKQAMLAGIDAWATARA